METQELICTCCGDMLQGAQEPEHDIGYGVCDDCERSLGKEARR